jgi:hypothetical protein
MTINQTIEHYWRSWAGIVYLFICLVDFFIAPLMWNIGMSMMDKEIQMATSRWTPLTLEGGAMLHLSFGAILGATAYNKHKEKNENT